jgi:hypothetical protein
MRGDGAIKEGAEAWGRSYLIPTYHVEQLAWAKSMAGGEIGLESAALVAQEREGDGERRLVPRRKGAASKFCI